QSGCCFNRCSETRFLRNEECGNSNRRQQRKQRRCIPLFSLFPPVQIEFSISKTAFLDRDQEEILAWRTSVLSALTATTWDGSEPSPTWWRRLTTSSMPRCSSSSTTAARTTLSA